MNLVTVRMLTTGGLLDAFLVSVVVDSRVENTLREGNHLPTDKTTTFRSGRGFEWDRFPLLA